MKFARAGIWCFALSVLAAMPAMAQTFGSPDSGADGLYLRGEGGWSHLNDMSGYTTGGASYTSKQDEGYIAGGALGWKFDQLRVELGLDFSNSGVKSVTLNNVSGAGGGEVHNTATMVNALWDFRTGTFIVPYIGIGVGASYVTLDNVKRNGALMSDSSQTVFAYQPMIGVNFQLTDQLALGIQYRYFATVDPSFNYAPGGKLGVKNDSHNVLAGLTWSFGVTPPPPPSAPAPVFYQPPPVVNPQAGPPPAPQPQVFVVFFEFNQAALTPEGKRVAQQAAAAFQQDGATSVELTGYTDLTGKTRYDLDLSRRRALAVRDYLVQLGVPFNAIAASWHGKQDPRVPATGREPQNRRVEIDIP
jgi:outer membrane protein OmpA-like peptidoglycan-associated protein